MNRIRIFAIFLVAVFIGLKSHAQTDRCVTEEYNKYLDSLNPSRPNSAQFAKWLAYKLSIRNEAIFSTERKQAVYMIPVVVHIINNGEPIGEGTNIPDEQVQSQIDVLNEDYRRLNPDTVFTPGEFKPVAADAGIEFRLATRDPDGNPTNGIVRVQGSKTKWFLNSDDQLLKSQSFWPSEDYLNIWVCNLSGALGYAQYPVTDLPGSEPPYDRETDGVVINYIAFGSSNKGSFRSLSVNYALGRTATHEIGHFLSLRHIWGDDFGTCNGDDYCDDTPLQTDSHDECTTSSTFFSCGSDDMYDNYMDYSWDQCMNIFTQDQINRMRTVMENSPRRKSLLSSPGLYPSGGYPNDVSIIEIGQPADISCNMEPQPVLGLRNSGYNTIHALTILYSIDDGSLSTIHSSVSLNPGDYQNLTLPAASLSRGQHFINFNITQVNDSIDIDSANNIAGKYFLADNSQDIIPHKNNFRSGAIDGNGWSVYNPDNLITWEISDAPIDFKPNYSALIRYFDYSEKTRLDWLVSPVLDLSDALVARLTFSCSYAKRSSLDDVLQVRVSTDCGETFSNTAFQSTGSNLSQTTSNSSWVPKTEDDWHHFSVNLDGYVGEKNVRVAFLGQNGNGNNLYLDNIEFYSTGYSTKFSTKGDALYVFPNPVTGNNFYVSVKSDTREDAMLSIMDQAGRVVQQNELKDVLNQTYQINLEGRVPGLYILNVKGKSFSYSNKIVIAR